MIELAPQGVRYARQAAGSNGAWFSVVPLLGGDAKAAPPALLDQDVLIVDAGPLGLGPPGQEIAVSRGHQGRNLRGDPARGRPAVLACGSRRTGLAGDPMGHRAAGLHKRTKPGRVNPLVGMGRPGRARGTPPLAQRPSRQEPPRRRPRRLRAPAGRGRIESDPSRDPRHGHDPVRQGQDRPPSRRRPSRRRGRTTPRRDPPVRATPRRRRPARLRTAIAAGVGPSDAAPSRPLLPGGPGRSHPARSPKSQAVSVSKTPRRSPRSRPGPHGTPMAPGTALCMSPNGLDSMCRLRG